MNKCEICSSDKNVHFNKKCNKFLCHGHYDQYRRYGIFKIRLTSTPNEIVVYENYAEIILYNQKCEEVARTKIDLDFVEEAKKYKWSLDGDGYAKTRTKKLHHFILPKLNGFEPDHKNTDKLDNRKLNLRYATISQNNMNVPLRKNNTSGVTGISRREKTGKWRAYIKINRKKIELGEFVNIDTAIKARLDAELKYHKEFSYQC